MNTSYQPPPDGWHTFLIVWITQSVSVIGSALTLFAITIWLTTVLYPAPEQKPQLAWALSAINLAFAAPVVFGAPIAGAFADRHDRKRIMIITDTASGMVSLIAVFLIATRQLNLFGLIAIGTLSSIFTSFHNAAFETSYSMLVAAEKLPRANGMMQTTWSLSGILAPGIAAALIGLPALAYGGQLPGLAFLLGQIPDGTVLAIGVDALTFFLAASAPLFLNIPSPRRVDLVQEGGQVKSIGADILEGALYIWRRRSFLWLLSMFTVANIVGGVEVLLPLLLKFQVAPDWTSRGLSYETTLAILTTTGSAGGIAGGFLISAWGGLKKNRIFGVLIPMLFYGVGTALLGLSTSLFMACASEVLSAVMIMLLSAHSQAIWQVQTPHELQGRVFSVRRLIAQISWPASSLLMGFLASRYDPGRIIFLAGVILFTWCGLNLFNPYLLHLENREWIETQAVGQSSSSMNSG